MIEFQILTFAYSDSDADGVGDFNGIRQRLSHLKDVGFTAVWPTPLLKTSKEVFDPASIVDHLTIDLRFGGSDESQARNDLRLLIQEAHDKGLKFIADLPLTVDVKRNEWVKKHRGVLILPNNNSNEIGVLNFGHEIVQNLLVDAAGLLIDLGVDMLHLTDYGHLKVI